MVWCGDLAPGANRQWQPVGSRILDCVTNPCQADDVLSNGWAATDCWLCASDPSCGSGCSVWESLGHSAKSTRLWYHPSAYSYLVRRRTHWSWLSGAQWHWFFPIYDPVIAANFVWNPGGYICYVWLWERVWIYKYPATRWSDCRHRASKGTAFTLLLSNL